MSKLRKSVVVSDSNYTPESSPRIKISEKSLPRKIGQNKSSIGKRNVSKEKQVSDQQILLLSEMRSTHQKSKSALRSSKESNAIKNSREDSIDKTSDRIVTYTNNQTLDSKKHSTSYHMKSIDNAKSEQSPDYSLH